MIVIGTEFYKSFKQKEMIMRQIKKNFDKVWFSFTDNLVIYQYNDSRTDV